MGWLVSIGGGALVALVAVTVSVSTLTGVDVEDSPADTSGNPGASVYGNN